MSRETCEGTFQSIKHIPGGLGRLPGNKKGRQMYALGYIMKTMKGKQCIKKLLRNILFGGMFLLFACSNEEQAEIVSIGEVKFGIALPDTWEDNQASRGDIVDKQQLATDGFGVFAFYKQNNPDFMNNTKVISTDQGKTWSYSPIKYWPHNQEDKIDFFAYAPYDPSFTVTNRSLLDYEVPVEVKQQKDLMWSNTNTINCSKETGTVSFNFRHALSRIGFTAIGKTNGTSPLQEGVYIYIQKLVLTKADDNTGTATSGPFYFKGVLELNNTNSTPIWKSLDAPNCKFTLTSSHFVGGVDTGFLLQNSNTASPVPLNAADSYLMVLPQDLSSDGFNIYMEYEVCLEGHDSFSYVNKHARNVKLNLEAGMAYTLNLIVGLDEFTIDPDIIVTAWDQDENEYDINVEVPAT